MSTNWGVFNKVPSFFDLAHLRGKGKNPSKNFGHFWAIDFQEFFFEMSWPLGNVIGVHFYLKLAFEASKVPNCVFGGLSDGIMFQTIAVLKTSFTTSIHDSAAHITINICRLIFTDVGVFIIQFIEKLMWDLLLPYFQTKSTDSGGRIVVYGDSNCVDSAHLTKDCWWLMDAILEYTSMSRLPGKL